MTDTINEWDVLFGRGGKSNTFSGNRRHRALIVKAQAEYLAARKKDKISIAQRIVAATQANGGRFLMRDSASGKDQWIEVSDARAIAKTSQGLREGLDVRRNKFRPTKIYKHIDDDTDSVKRSSSILGKVVTTKQAVTARDVTPDPTPATSPSGPRPLAVPSQISILELDRVECNLAALGDDVDDYICGMDVLMPRLGYELQHIFDM
ncbi:hypothetical protein MPSEU_000636700 [Mayamaea pseudoterrestris]|nr:hypothetical protein MPSEU_000636700 [Mayamaea pseudoterrestris]